LLEVRSRGNQFELIGVQNLLALPKRCCGNFTETRDNAELLDTVHLFPWESRDWKASATPCTAMPADRLCCAHGALEIQPEAQPAKLRAIDSGYDINFGIRVRLAPARPIWRSCAVDALGSRLLDHAPLPG
jgi:hypothetical protein